MVSTFTPNIQWEEPARGDQVGVWDTPVNNNGTLIDKVVGGITTIGLNNSNVVLSSPQYQSKTIIFNSTLTGSVIITFPTSFVKSYEIQNLCTGTSAFTITLQTTAAGGRVIGCQPADSFDAVNDGTNLRYHNIGRVGSYWDYAGSSVPNWVSACTVAPWLNCDGTAFSSATFPALAMVLNGTTLPDSRGRTRYCLNQGTGRLTSAGAALDGNTFLATGGGNGLTLSASQAPAGVVSNNAAQSLTIQVGAKLVVTDVGALVGQIAPNDVGTAFRVPYTNTGWSPVTNFPAANYAITTTSVNASQAPVGITAPALVSGLTLIRAG